MKKFLIGFVSLALVLLVGVSLVGCGKKTVAYSLSRTTDASNNWRIENGVNGEKNIVAKNEQGNKELAQGVQLILKFTNSNETSYTVTKGKDEASLISGSFAELKNNQTTFTIKWAGPSDKLTNQNCTSKVLEIVCSQGSNPTGKDKLESTTIKIYVKYYVTSEA